MKAPLKRSVLAGRFIAGSGIVVVVSFFLPMVRGCGAEVSAYKATQVNWLFWLYLAAGIVLLACGLALFKLTTRVLLYLASGVASVPLLHLIYKSARELIDGGELEPLVGYWMLLFSLAFAAIFPWIARRSMAREHAGRTASGGGGRVTMFDEEEDTETHAGGKVSFTFDDDED